MSSLGFAPIVHAIDAAGVAAFLRQHAPQLAQTVSRYMQTNPSIRPAIAAPCLPRAVAGHRSVHQDADEAQGGAKNPMGSK